MRLHKISVNKSDNHLHGDGALRFCDTDNVSLPDTDKLERKQQKKKPVEKHARWLPRYTLSTAIRSPMLFTFFFLSMSKLV